MAALPLEVSAYSLTALVGAMRPLLAAAGSSSVVALDFDATVAVATALTGWAWPRPPSDPWPAIWRATSAPAPVRVNLVAAGPVRTMAAKSIPSFSAFEDTWGQRAPRSGFGT